MTTWTQSAQIQTTQHPSMKKIGNGFKLPPLTQKLFAIDNLLEKEKSVFSKNPTGDINHNSGQAPYSRVVGQQEMNSGIFVDFMFPLLFFFFFIGHFIFYISNVIPLPCFPSENPLFHPPP